MYSEAYRKEWRRLNPEKMKAQRQRTYLRHKEEYKKYKKRYVERHVWQNMINRCTNPLNHAWQHYGGRGIKVCSRWLDSFSSFLKDMGKRPAVGLSLDRINNDGNYTPSNCRWADASTQRRNRRLPCH